MFIHLPLYTSSFTFSRTSQYIPHHNVFIIHLPVYASPVRAHTPATLHLIIYVFTHKPVYTTSLRFYITPASIHLIARLHIHAGMPFVTKSSCQYIAWNPKRSGPNQIHVVYSPATCLKMKRTMLEPCYTKMQVCFTTCNPRIQQLPIKRYRTSKMTRRRAFWYAVGFATVLMQKLRYSGLCREFWAIKGSPFSDRSRSECTSVGIACSDVC